MEPQIKVNTFIKETTRSRDIRNSCFENLKLKVSTKIEVGNRIFVFENIMVIIIKILQYV